MTAHDRNAEEIELAAYCDLPHTLRYATKTDSVYAL